MTKLYTNECLYKDVYTIIEMMNYDMRSKININFIEFLKENQDATFEGTIDKNIPIKNQNLREEVKIMLSLIYINYLCEEKEKIEILERENENINNFYNVDIFKNRRDKKENNLAVVEYKEGFFRQIINKLRSLLLKK